MKSRYVRNRKQRYPCVAVEAGPKLIGGRTYSLEPLMFRAAICLLILTACCGPSPGQPEALPPPRVYSEEIVIQSLIEALGDTDYEVRSHLGSALASYGPRAAPLLI